MVSTGNTEVGAADASTQTPDATAGLAAKRRNRKSTVPAEHPTGAPPVPVQGETSVAVVASRTLVSSFAGGGGPARPTGGVWLGEPLVLETSPYAVGGVAVESPLYVIAECDAEERMVPPGCYTPVSRTLWRRGNRVRRDLYERVLAEHAAKAGAGADPAAAEPAALPTGIDELPADAVARAASPER